MDGDDDDDDDEDDDDDDDKLEETVEKTQTRLGDFATYGMMQQHTAKCLPNVNPFPYIRPSAPDALAPNEQKIPVQMNPIVPPKPCTVNTSKESSIPDSSLNTVPTK